MCNLSLLACSAELLASLYACGGSDEPVADLRFNVTVIEHRPGPQCRQWQQRLWPVQLGTRGSLRLHSRVIDSLPEGRLFYFWRRLRSVRRNATM
jgi:hypothetical protein